MDWSDLEERLLAENFVPANRVEIRLAACLVVVLGIAADPETAVDPQETSARRLEIADRGVADRGIADLETADLEIGGCRPE